MPMLQEFNAELEVPHWVDIDQEIRRCVANESAHQAGTRGSQTGNRNYVVMLASGNQDGGKRATLAFSAACAAIAIDLDTHVFLIGDGAHWAYEGSCEPVLQQGFPALTDLMDSFTEMGGKIYICSTCDSVCGVPGEEGQKQPRRKEIQPRGLAAVLSHMVGGTSVTF